MSLVAKSQARDAVPPPVSAESALIILGNAIDELSLAETPEDVHRISRETALRLIDAACEPADDTKIDERLNLAAIVGPDTDTLTGVANGHGWENTLTEAVSEQTLPLCIALVDLDHLRAVNEAWGAAAGDRLLVDASRAWQDVLRDGDLLARLEGGRFAVMFGGCDMRDARYIAERLRQAVPHGQTASVGIASWNGTENRGELIARADAALRSAKVARGEHLVQAA